MALLESLALERPVVATRVRRNPEVIEHERHGLLVGASDPAALADACGRLIVDADLARSLGSAGRRRVQERFSAASNARQMIKLYRELTTRTSVSTEVASARV